MLLHDPHHSTDQSYSRCDKSAQTPTRLSDYGYDPACGAPNYKIFTKGVSPLKRIALRESRGGAEMPGRAGRRDTRRPVNMIKLTKEREIDPYLWVHQTRRGEGLLACQSCKMLPRALPQTSNSRGRMIVNSIQAIDTAEFLRNTPKDYSTCRRHVGRRILFDGLFRVSFRADGDPCRNTDRGRESRPDPCRPDAGVEGGTSL
jgi:hypothetical protein